MSLRISIVSIALATLAGACGRGDALDPLREEVKDTGTAACPMTLTSMCGTTPTVKTTVVTFPDAPVVQGCNPLKTLISAGSILLDGTVSNFVSLQNSSFNFNCWVTSNAVAIPSTATRIMLRFKATHSFASNTSNPAKPRVTYGSLKVRDQAQSSPIGWHVGFVTKTDQAYEVRMELPQTLAGKSVVLEPQLSGLAYDWGMNEHFADLQLTLTDLTIEATQ